MFRAIGEIAPSVCNHGVQTIDATRRARLERLIAEHKTLAALNEALGLDRTDATLSQIRNQALGRNGVKRSMGDVLARRIETTLKLPTGWMDTPIGYAPDDARIPESLVIKVMEHMTHEQKQQVVKVVSALAEPGAKTGTEG